MVRPTKCRRICQMPDATVFAPVNIRRDAVIQETECKAVLALDEYETLRLIDYLGYNQAECAAQMNVARTTVQLIYDSARKKLADALVNQKLIMVNGGNYEICGDSAGCCGKNCAHNKCARRCCHLNLSSNIDESESKDCSNVLDDCWTCKKKTKQ